MSIYFGHLLFSSFVITSCYDVVSCVIQEQMLLTKDSLSQNMEAIKRKYEVQCICIVCFLFLKVCCVLALKCQCAVSLLRSPFVDEETRKDDV